MPAHLPFASSRPLIYAHRGLHTGCAENTLEAFRAALEAGADWIETDVNTTADGVVVAFHDSTLNRLTGQGGRITDLTWNELRDINLTGGGKIPSLEQVLAAFPQARFNIDLKDAASATRIVPVLVAADATDRVRLASFSERRLRQAHVAARKAGVGVALSASQLIVTAFYLASRIHPALWSLIRKVAGPFLLPFDAVQVPAYHRVAGRRLRIVDRAFVAAACRAGAQVHVWTVDDEPTMRELMSLGVDGIVTNRTDLLTGVLASSPYR